MAQDWHPVPGIPGIELSADAQRVRSVAKTITYQHAHRQITRSFPSKELTITTPKGGYPNVWVSSLRMAIGMHVIVCRVFHGEPNGRMALHRNGDVLDWHPDNLYWGTHVDNAADAKKHGTLAVGAKHGAKTHPKKFTGGMGGANKKLTEKQVLEIRASCVRGNAVFGCKPLARKFGVDPAAIRKVLNGTTYMEVI